MRPPGSCWPKPGKKCRVEKFEDSPGEAKVTRAFQLKSGERSWTIMVRDQVRAPKRARLGPAARPPAASPAEFTPSPV